MMRTALCLLLIPLVLHADSPRAKPWPMEVIRLTNGAVLRGLVLSADDRVVRFQCVHRHPGRPTVSFPTVIYRAEIAQMERLPDDQRDILRARLDALEQSTPEGEKERMEDLDLRETAWGSRPDGGWRYDSDYFTLTSNAPEEVVRRAALRLEQIYVAYSRYLPPRHRGAAPTAVLLLTDQSEYQKLLAAQKTPLLNLAFYDPAANRIVCYSDLQQLGERLVAVRRYHRKMRGELEAKRTELARLYKGKELARVLAPIEDARIRLDRADRMNDELFATASRQLFSTLYHEAFHAYLAGFVYRPASGTVPHWLNEGLAQIFETAILEGNELRVGHAEGARLTRAKDAASRGELVPLGDLLRSGPKQFALAHAADRQVSDRHYLTSWALAFYLSFERRLLGTTELDHFISQVKDEDDPRSAFEQLVGRPLTKFEAEFRRYLLYLQPDGSVKSPPK